MKKKTIGITAVAVAAALCAGIAFAQSQKITADRLVKNALGRNCDSLNTTLKVDIDSEIDMTKLGMESTMPAVFNLELETEEDAEGSAHAKGKINYNMFDMENEESTEEYRMVGKDGKKTSYIYNTQTDKWAKFLESEAEEESATATDVVDAQNEDAKNNTEENSSDSDSSKDNNTEDYSSMKDTLNGFFHKSTKNIEYTLKENKSSDKEYVVTAKVPIEKLKDLGFGDILATILIDVDNLSDDYKKVNFDTEMTFSKDTKLIKKLTLKLNQDSLNEGVTDKFKTFDIEMDFDKIGGVKVELPKDIEKNAISMEDLIDEITKAMEEKEEAK